MSNDDEKNIVLERFYTIPLGKAHLAAHRKRASKAVKIVRYFAFRHMKPEALIVDPELNEILWERGLRKSLRRVKVRATKDDEGVVRVRLAKVE